MELDELKKKLNEQMTAAQQKRSAEDITSLLKNNAASVVQKLKRSLTIELILTIVFVIVCCITLTLINKWAYLIFLVNVAILGLLVSIALAFLLWKINKLSNSILTVKRNLEVVITIIKQYAWLYIRIGMALLPLSFGLAFWLSYMDPESASKPIRWDVFIYMLAALSIFSFASFRFTKWYLQKLYGNYVHQLEILLREFEEE